MSIEEELKALEADWSVRGLPAEDEKAALALIAEVRLLRDILDKSHFGKAGGFPPHVLRVLRPDRKLGEP